MFNYEKAGKLLEPSRKELIPTEKVIELLAIDKSHVCADLGCGNGYLTLPIAEKVNTDVKAVDIQPEMLELLSERAEEHKVFNIQYIEASLEEIPLGEDSLDRAVAAFVLHEIPNLAKTISDVKSFLKEGGKWLILDWEAVESPQGPPLHHRISSEKLEEMVKQQGFKTQSGHLHPSVYYIIAE